VQATYERLESPAGAIYANNWDLLKVGVIFAIAANVMNAVPFAQTTVYSSEGSNGSPDVTVTVSPLALALGVTADVLIIANSVRCLRYTANVANSVRAHGIRLSVRPERTRSGATGLALVCCLD
jgi:hypothetical protein